jgi:hypothetical protein
MAFRLKGVYQRRQLGVGRGRVEGGRWQMADEQCLYQHWNGILTRPQCGHVEAEGRRAGGETMRRRFESNKVPDDSSLQLTADGDDGYQCQ